MNKSIQQLGSYCMLLGLVFRKSVAKQLAGLKSILSPDGAPECKNVSQRAKEI